MDRSGIKKQLVIMKIVIGLSMLFLIATNTSAQKYYTRSGHIKFVSVAPIENIEAMNNKATCILDIKTGEVISKILMKTFEFEKALMQEHFNENYVESDKFPLAILKAKIDNLSIIDTSGTTPQQIKIQGDLTIHNITQLVEIDGEISKIENGFKATAYFIVKPSDYKIKIPKAVKNHIAQEVEVSLDFSLEKLK